MPKYQYACTACSEQLEVHQSFTDDTLTECPACEGRLRKVFNAVGVVFKGSGFYKTDSRRSAATGAGDSGESGSGSGKESGSGSGKESSGSSTADQSAGSTPSKPSKPAKSDGSAKSSAA